jgi:hypothetical protein
MEMPSLPLTSLPYAGRRLNDIGKWLETPFCKGFSTANNSSLPGDGFGGGKNSLASDLLNIFCSHENK